MELMGGMESDNFRWYKVLLMKGMALISHLISQINVEISRLTGLLLLCSTIIFYGIKFMLHK